MLEIIAHIDVCINLEELQGDILFSESMSVFIYCSSLCYSLRSTCSTAGQACRAYQACRAGRALSNTRPSLILTNMCRTPGHVLPVLDVLNAVTFCNFLI